MFRKGDYKIVRMNDGPWELYNMEQDPTEMNNLSPNLPAKVTEMDSLYARLEPMLNKKSYATNPN